MPGEAPTRAEQALLFAKNFFKHPRMLGSIIPSSRFLIHQLVRDVDWENARVFVEYGPGIGNITQEVLQRMHPDAKLVVFETNVDFVDFLERWFDDARLHVVHGSAADVSETLAKMDLDGVDYAISGIPFTTIPHEVRTKILRETHASLKPGGEFLVYQVMRTVLPYLEEWFGHVRTEREPLNVPPMYLFYCRR